MERNGGLGGGETRRVDNHPTGLGRAGVAPWRQQFNQPIFPPIDPLDAPHLTMSLYGYGPLRARRPNIGHNVLP